MLVDLISMYYNLRFWTTPRIPEPLASPSRSPPRLSQTQWRTRVRLPWSLVPCFRVPRAFVAGAHCLPDALLTDPSSFYPQTCETEWGRRDGAAGLKRLTWRSSGPFWGTAGAQCWAFWTLAGAGRFICLWRVPCRGRFVLGSHLFWPHLAMKDCLPLFLFPFFRAALKNEGYKHGELTELFTI